MFEVWLHFFSIMINTFPDNKADALLEHTIMLFNDIIKKKVTPTKNGFNKLIKSCARASLAKMAVKVFKSMPDKFKEDYMYYYSLIHGFEIESQVKFRRKESVLQTDNTEYVFNLIERNLMIPFVVCILCRLKGLERLIKVEEVLLAFGRKTENEYITCPYCNGKFIPFIHLIDEENEKFIVTESFILMSPVALIKEIDKIIKQYGDRHFFFSDYFRKAETSHIFWNIVFYVNVMNLPHYVLAVNNSEDQINHIIEQLRHRNMNDTNEMNYSFRLNTVHSEAISRNHSIASYSALLKRS